MKGRFGYPCEPDRAPPAGVVPLGPVGAAAGFGLGAPTGAAVSSGAAGT